MIERILKKELVNLASQYRVVTVLGPRQAGKSTLCRSTFPQKPTINLEDPELRKLAELDPKGLLSQFPEGCFIDEIQRCPELLSYIQVIVDKDNTSGQFILSGSHQLSLQQAVSQSLAGRTAIVKLLPLSQEELVTIDSQAKINEILVRGSYPEIVANNLQPAQAFSFYVQTYLERDVRQMQAVRDLSLFQSFLSLLAGRSGCLLNISSLANELGVSENTVKNWISIAEATFVVFRLRPYYKNLTKRQVKSPKLYFYDTGLLCYLLGIRTAEQLQNHPSRGAIFETYVVSEVMKYLWNRVRESNLYFFADNQLELDLLAETSNGLLPIEIKSSSTFRDDLLKQLIKADSRLPVSKGNILVYAGDSSQQIHNTKIISCSKLAVLGEAVCA